MTIATFFHSATIKKIVFASLAAASVSAAHYIGFLSEVPLQILSVAGPVLAPSLVGTFAFYVLVSVALARVFTQVIGAAIIAAAVLAVRITEFKKLRFVRFFIRVFQHEGPLFLALQVVLFTVAFSEIYLHFSWKQLSVTVVLTTILLMTAALLRTDTLPLSPKIFIDRLRSPRRKAFRRKLVVTLLSSAVGAALAIAFYTGKKRAEYLTNATPVSYSDDAYTGSLHVMLSSTEATLAIERAGSEARFIFLSDRFVLTQAEKQPEPAVFTTIRKGRP